MAKHDARAEGRKKARLEPEAISEEIISIRARLAQVQEGLDALPESAEEAISALQQRDHYLHERLAELQYMLTDFSQSKIDPDELRKADQSSLPPF